MRPHSTYTRRIPFAVPALLVLALCVLVALTVTGTAAAQKSKGTACGKKVLEDWYDNGRIDRLYPLHCYEEAIDAIPDDIRDYADAEEVISRALQGALRNELVPGGPDPTPGDDPTGDGGAGGTGDTGGTGGSEAAPNVDTSGPSSLPIPLLVLGGMSLALLAAGGLGYLARRRAAAQAHGEGDDDFVG